MILWRESVKLISFMRGVEGTIPTHDLERESPKARALWGFSWANSSAAQIHLTPVPIHIYIYIYIYIYMYKL
jgi:hypothetical protein